MNSTIRVFVLGGEALYRTALVAALRHQEGLVLVGESATQKNLAPMLTAAQAELLIADIDAPGTLGILAEVFAQAPTLKYIALSRLSAGAAVTEALRLPCTGYVLKTSGLTNLVEALRVVQSGQVYLAPSVAAVAMLLARGDAPPAGPEDVPVSAREREILAMIAGGMATKQIAAALGVSAKTVETHRLRLMRKLRIFTIAELTKYAVRTGLTEL